LLKRDYVLITPARDEEAFIEKTIQSVAAQTVLPRKWVIVNDNSRDATERIILDYRMQYRFIDLLNLSKNGVQRNFASQVHAIRAGHEQLKKVNYSWIGNLDADISLPPDYYERIIDKFIRNPKLGLAGGFVHEKTNGSFHSRRYNHPQSIPHAVQFFRRECFDSINGYMPLKYGGPDWCAEVMARMKGWQTESYPEITVFHHRHTGSVEGILNAKFRLGLMDYSLGSDPVFEIIKCMYRLREKPYILSSIFRLAGFCWLYIRREQRMVPDDFVSYLRKEQKERVANLLKIKNRNNGHV
jgi:glycosyltransferase involved in cell wall biosynthesis